MGAEARRRPVPPRADSLDESCSTTLPSNTSLF
uniref:Uncharacterized protein n=1 Tax=Arundo donax TaxID=35708 RepID=A0A0A9I0Y8_ARUDO